MNQTKRTFLKTSSILTIIFASITILMSFLFFLAAALVTEDFLFDIFSSDPTATVIEYQDGEYEIIYIEDGEEVSIDSENLSMIAKVFKVGFVFIGCLSLGFSIAQLILSIKLLSATNKNINKKGLAIAVLVLSVLSGSLLVAGFLIAAICIKDKNEPKADDQSNKDEIVLKDI